MNEKQANADRQDCSSSVSRKTVAVGDEKREREKERKKRSRKQISDSR